MKNYLEIASTLKTEYETNLFANKDGKKGKTIINSKIKI